VVNIPEFRLRAYDENFKIGVTMNVVVGRAYGHSTPVFSQNMQYLLFRPYWDVPASITRAEIIPHLQKDPDYLGKDRLQIVDNRRNPVSTGPVTSDMIDQLRAGKLFIRQIPGPKNSLGLVVFLFPNSTPYTCTILRPRSSLRSHGGTSATAASGWKNRPTWRRGCFATSRVGHRTGFARPWRAALTPSR